jgi:hypothetical protein
MSSQPVPFSWQQVDETLASLMLAELSGEFGELNREDEQQIRFQNIGNGNSVTAPSQRLEMQLLRSDEWAARIYEVYCEVWRCQQKSLSPQFLRAVCQHGIRVLISVRVNAVSSELGMEQMRTHSYNSEWLKAVTAGFSRNMELLFGKWRRAAEIDAKSLEYMLAAAPNNPTVNDAARELVHARTQLRIFEAKVATIDTKIAGWERALSATQLRETNAYRTKTIEQYLERLNADKKELGSRRHYWHLSLNAALRRSAEVQKQDTPDQPPLRASTGVAGEDQTEPSERRPNLRYRSAIKRAILVCLTQNPNATDLEVCRGLDADGAELPTAWSLGKNRSFEIVYKNEATRGRIESMISKVRADLRKNGILP